MELSRGKVFSLVVVLVLGLLVTGCMQNGELALVNSNLINEDQQQVDPDLNKIRLEFNQQITKAQASLWENKQQVPVTVAVGGQVVKLKELKLTPLSSYQLKVSVQDKQGTQVQETFSFQTKRGAYPQIEKQNQTLMQTFYWELAKGEYAEKHPEEGNLWKLLAKRSDKLAKKGITELWIPPANKAHERADEGYGIYDPWDLGEFKQAGTVRTKYGTRQQLETALDQLHQAGIKVYYDAVLNHRIAAGSQNLQSVPFSSGKTNKVYTKFAPLKGRQQYYSKADQWQWDWKCFDGVDYTQERGKIKPSLFKDKSWDATYDKDYLLASDVDYQNQQVRHEMKEWGRWLVNDIGFDGFRIDAVKHIDSSFINSWVTNIQQSNQQDIRFIGEAWIQSSMGLKFYLMAVDNPNLDLFDFALRQTFKKLRDGNLNMSTLDSAGLANSKYKDRAVMFVDNHDTGRDEVEYNRPIDNRKLQAYTYILTRAHGTPMVYWKDYYVSGYQEELNKLLEIRKYFAYGPGRSAKTNDGLVYSYVREGLKTKPGTGLVAMITGGESGETITKQINTGQSETTFYDYTGNVEGKVTTDEQGVGEFKVKNSVEQGWSVWVPLRN